MSLEHQEWVLKAKADGEHPICVDCGEPGRKDDFKGFEKRKGRCDVCHGLDAKLKYDTEQEAARAYRRYANE